VGRLNARNTLNKNGVVLNFAVDDCGHWGRLSVGLYVHPGAPRVKIKHMARFLGIQFFRIGPSNPYEGVYQGGKRYNNGEIIEGFVGEEENDSVG
jgi:deoxycytidine triphosphate deaminase